MAVEALNKPNGVRCVHLTPSGCGIYGEHPEECQRFACLWLRNDPKVSGDMTARPDRTGGVLVTERNDEGALAMVVYSTEKDERRALRSRHIYRMSERAARAGNSVVMTVGPRRTVLVDRGRLLSADKRVELPVIQPGNYGNPPAAIDRGGIGGGSDE